MKELKELLEKYPPIVCMTVQGKLTPDQRAFYRESLKNAIKDYSSVVLIENGEYSKLEILTVFGAIPMSKDIEERVKELIG